MGEAAPRSYATRRRPAALVLVLLMLAYAAAFDLDSWAEWLALGAIYFTAVGALVAVQVRSN